MKKTVLYLVVAVMFLLAACGNNSDKEQSKSETKGSKDTVKIENNYKMRGEKKDGSDAKKVKETVEVPKNPKNAVVLDYGALDVMKEMGLSDKVKALPKGEGGKSLPNFLESFKDDKYTNVGNLKEVNFDKIAATKPEVIFISGRTANQKNLISSMKQNTENIGKIYDKEDKAKELNKDLDNKIASMKDKTKKFNKSVMYLLVNEGELSTYGPKGRFGGLVYDTLGFNAVDKKVSNSNHGQNVSNEYINKENPDVILAMDRGQAVSGKSTAKQALNNPVLKNVKAIKEDKVYNLDPKLWYFAAGSTTTTIKQIDELEKVVK
ncbi:TPA: siderophore ABC transporter substrate-binding protein [Staphylococcus aureus]|nr:siderophore ABC transporter substrate-binding protein [Staphylococcus aureus]